MFSPNAFKQPRRKVNQSASQLHSFYDNTPVLMGIVELTEADQIIHLSDNPAAESFFHVQAKCTMGKSAEELGAPPEAIRQWVAHYRQSQQIGRPVSFEYIHPSPQGTLWLAVTVAPVGRGPSGRMRFSYVADDVTKRKQAEAALQESEARFRGVFDNAALGITLVSLNGQIISANPKSLEMLGYEAGEFSRMAIKDFIHPEDYLEDSRLTHELIAGKRDDYQLENRYICKDGRVIWGRLTCSLVYAPEGKPLHVIRLIEDINAHKLMEKALQGSEARFREMLGTVQLLALMWNPEGTITFCNDYLLRLTGWSREEMLGQSCVEMLIPAQERNAFMDALQISDLGQKFSPHYESHIVTRSGERRLILWDSTLLHDAEGHVAGVASLGRDITEQRSLEEQLRHAQKMEAIGTLAGGIAHDFNNILSPIVGYSDMLRDRFAKDKQALDYIDGILAASQRAKDLVQQILSFSRYRKDQIEPVQVHLIVQEIIRFLLSTLPASITVTHALEKRGDTVLADPTQIHQIILNLCTNAYQAMHPSDGILHIQSQAVNLDLEQSQNFLKLRPGAYVRIRVSDTGVGMDEATRKRIFEPFFTTKPVGEGTGLGLPVIHGIVMNLGGEIRVTSEPQKGSTFEIYLPCLDDMPKKRKKKVSLDQPIKGKGRILFVDDDPALIKVVKAMLKGLGYQVSEMTDSTAALKAFCAAPDKYDLLFTDQTMPGLSGLDLCREVKAIRSDIPILLYTGHGKSITADKARKSGVGIVLKKPLRLGELSRTIQRLLSRKL